MKSLEKLSKEVGTDAIIRVRSNGSLDVFCDGEEIGNIYDLKLSIVNGKGYNVEIVQNYLNSDGFLQGYRMAREFINAKTYWDNIKNAPEKTIDELIEYSLGEKSRKR